MRVDLIKPHHFARWSTGIVCSLRYFLTKETCLRVCVESKRRNVSYAWHLIDSNTLHQRIVPNKYERIAPKEGRTNRAPQYA